MNPKKKVLFVRSGGGFPGIDLHVGMWLALEKAGIRSTHCYGTSAGAIVSAVDASGLSAAAAHVLAVSACDRLLRVPRPLWKLRAFFIDHFLSARPMAEWLKANLPARFDLMAKPLAIAATRERDGLAWLFLTGWLLDALMASMAIPGVFPAMRVGDDWFSDGGTTNNLPLPSNWMDYDEVFLLVASRPLAYRQRKSDIIGRLLHAVDLLAEDQINDVIHQVAAHTYMEGFAAVTRGDGPPVFVIRPAVDLRSGMLRFDHELIGLAEDQARYQFMEQKGDLINAIGRIP